MLRNLHQSKYSQLIPGINRDDEEIRYTHGEPCISYYGDGLPQPQKLLADARNAHQRGRHTKLWNEQLNRKAENGIAEALQGRESKIGQWKELLNKEVDNLAEEANRLEDWEREVSKKGQYFKDLERISKSVNDFRQRIPGRCPDDHIDNLQKEEMRAIHEATDQMRQCSKDLQDSRRKVKEVRSTLMSEVEAKALTFNVNKRCQYAEPLLTHTHIPASHPLYHNNCEDDWERNLEGKMQSSNATRQEASMIRCRTDTSIQQNLSRTAEAWTRTTQAITEEVQRSERSVYNVKDLIHTIGEDISSTRHRIASLYDDLRVQDRGKNLQLWRLQVLTYRPASDHIRDNPVMKIDEEVENNKKKHSFISENLHRNKVLLQELTDEKQRQTLELERLTKRLFIERENCLGLRRTLTLLHS